MKVVIRAAAPADHAAAAVRPRPIPCAEGAKLRVGLSGRPVRELPAALRPTQRLRGRQWRAHFLTCAQCWDVWAREALDRGAVVVSPTRPPEGPC